MVREGSRRWSLALVALLACFFAPATIRSPVAAEEPVAVDAGLARTGEGPDLTALSPGLTVQAMTSYRAAGGFSVNRLLLQPTLSYRTTETEVRFGGLADAVDHLTPDPYAVLQLRDAFVKRSFDGGEVSVGLQQVVWGKADQIRILDRLHGFNRSELNMRPLAELRRPDWMIRGVRSYSESGSVELVAIPYATVDHFRRDSRFAPPFPTVLATAGYDDIAPNGLARSRFGANLRDTFGGTDLSLMVIQGPSAEGAYRSEPAPGGRSRLMTEHRQETLFGAGFERPIGSLVARGEATYSPQRYLAIATPSGLTVAPSPQTNALIGLDWMPNDWLLGAQLAVSSVMAPPSGYANPAQQYLGTLSMRREFGQGRYIATAFATLDLNRPDVWFRTEVSWLPPGTNLSLSLGLDLFEGNRNGVFGRYGSEDRVYILAVQRW